MRLPGVLSPWLLILTACFQVSAQAVISTHSGLVNYHEGSVFVEDQPLDQKFGTFSTLKDGSTLRTENGRVEILLTPGVFLRLDENSAVRMLSNALTDTRVEFLRGAAIVDSNQAAPGNSLVLVYKAYQVRFPKPGVYRLDSETEVFETYTGQAEILSAGQPAKSIDESHQFFFSIGTETNKYGEGAIDNFSEWARNRAETITADNRAAAQSSAPLPDPSTDPNSYPFGATVPVPLYNQPLYNQPSWGPIGGAVLVDSGFYGGYGPYGPFGGPWFPEPPLVIFVYPRFYGAHPIYGTPPRKAGYPILPPTRSGYPHPSPYRPAPIPLRTTMGGAGGTRMPVTRMAIAPPPRIVAPLRVVAPPRVVAPIAVRSVGVGAIHHR